MKKIRRMTAGLQTDSKKNCHLFLVRDKLVVERDDLYDGDLWIGNPEDAQIMTFLSLPNGWSAEEETALGQAVLEAFAQVRQIASLPERPRDYVPPYVTLLGFDSVEAFNSACCACSCKLHDGRVVLRLWSYDVKHSGFIHGLPIEDNLPLQLAIIGRAILKLLTLQTPSRTQAQGTDNAATLVREKGLRVAIYDDVHHTWHHEKYAADTTSVLAAFRDLDQFRCPYFDLYCLFPQGEAKSMMVMGGNGVYHIMAVDDSADEDPIERRSCGVVDAGEDMRGHEEVEVYHADYSFRVESRYLLSEATAKSVTLHFLECCEFSTEIQWD